MTVQETIDNKLRDTFAPSYLEVRNESGMHNVPSGSETHFNVTVVSATFAQKTRVARHQAVNRLLADELEGPVHALAIHAYTPDEWAARGSATPTSPDCRGGQAAERSASQD